MKTKLFTCLLPLAITASPAFAVFDSGSDGSDGPFNPQFNLVIDLAQAASASWNTPSPVLGQGVYDADQWAVVFKYTTIDIPPGICVKFTNHPSGAPVIWLATGDVNVFGTIEVDGQDGGSSIDPVSYAQPGPGGFAGGVRGIASTGSNVPSSGGFGPGGGDPPSDGAYASGIRVYGNDRIVPLIGGSGGAGRDSSFGGNIGGGGGAGGAILIASSTQIVLEAGSLITANGGVGGGSSGAGDGSGGAIRLVSNSVSGDGMLRALRGNGFDDGRIRVDADFVTLTDLGSPQWTTDFAPFPVFPPSNAPTLAITSIDGLPTSNDPLSGIQTTDTAINNGLPVSVTIEATNMPSLITVDVRIVPARGTPFTVTSTQLTSAGGGILTATATITFPPGKSEIQLRANWTP